MLPFDDPSLAARHAQTMPQAYVVRDPPSGCRVMVESRCGAVAVGRTYLLPPLSSGGASLVRPWLRFHTHRVTGGGHPPPVPTERGVRISRTNALRQLLHSTASACSSEYGRRSLGGSNGVRSLIWWK